MSTEKTKINKYVVWIEDYDAIMISIDQDVSRPDDPSDLRLISDHIVYYYGPVNYEVMNFEKLNKNQIQI